MNITQNTHRRVIRKASSSICKHRVAAIAFDRSGKLLFVSRNRPQFGRIGGGIHAEMEIIHRYGKKIKTIIIARVSKSGNLLPIHACKKCQAIADSMNIKIIPLLELI